MMIVEVCCPDCCYQQSVRIDATADDNDGFAESSCVKCGAEFIADWSEYEGLAVKSHPRQQVLL
jgi:hypothetical protein